LLVILAVVGGAGAVAIVSRRLRLPARIARLLTAFRSLADSPRDLAIVRGLDAGGRAGQRWSLLPLSSARSDRQTH